MAHTFIPYPEGNDFFNPTRFGPYVCIRGSEVGYDCIGTRTDDVLVVDIDPTSIFNKLKYTYTIKAFGAPKVHLDRDYSHVKVGDTTRRVMGS